MNDAKRSKPQRAQRTPRPRRTPKGFLEVGLNEKAEIVINLDEDRTGHIVFNFEQAHHLGTTLIRKAIEAAVIIDHAKKLAQSGGAVELIT